MKFVLYDKGPKRKNGQKYQLLLLLLLAPIALIYGSRAISEWSNFKKADLLVKQSDVLLEKGQVPQALKLLNEAVTIYPYHREAWSVLSLTYHWGNEHENELKVLNAASHYFPKDGELHRDIAIACHECGNHSLEMSELIIAQRLLADDSIFTSRLIERAQRENDKDYEQAAMHTNPSSTTALPQ